MSRQEVETTLTIAMLNKLFLARGNLSPKQKIRLDTKKYRLIFFKLYLEPDGIIEYNKRSEDWKRSVIQKSEFSTNVPYYGGYLSHNHLKQLYEELNEQTES